MRILELLYTLAGDAAEGNLAAASETIKAIINETTHSDSGTANKALLELTTLRIFLDVVRQKPELLLYNCNLDVRSGLANSHGPLLFALRYRTSVAGFKKMLCRFDLSATQLQTLMSNLISAKEVIRSELKPLYHDVYQCLQEQQSPIPTAPLPFWTYANDNDADHIKSKERIIAELDAVNKHKQATAQEAEARQAPVRSQSSASFQFAATAANPKKVSIAIPVRKMGSSG